jgi:hypothetical protein
MLVCGWLRSEDRTGILPSGFLCNGSSFRKKIFGGLPGSRSDIQVNEK